MNVVQAIERFQEITDALKRGDLDNPDACMAAFLDWCEGEGVDMRWFNRVTDKLPERLRLSFSAIKLALDNWRQAEIFGSDLDGVTVASYYSDGFCFRTSEGDQPVGVMLGIKRGNVTPAPPPPPPPPHVKVGHIFTYVRVPFAWLERPYDYTILWDATWRVPLALKNF